MKGLKKWFDPDGKSDALTRFHVGPERSVFCPQSPHFARHSRLFGVYLDRRGATQSILFQWGS
jgi:hypothetical protein